MTFTVPPADIEDLYALPVKEQRRLDLLLAALREIHTSKNKTTARKAIAARLHPIRGTSAESLKRHYRAYLTSGGDWRVLINRANLPAARRTTATGQLPADFIDYWRRLTEQNARKHKPAWRHLLTQWRSGADIPGYGTWKDWHLRAHPTQPLPHICPKNLPRGWSYANLIRLTAPKAEITAARRGIAAAIEHLPSLSLDTTALAPLEVIVFDDVRFDFQVAVPELGQLCELWGLIAMDLATRRIIRFGLRPALKREDGTKEALLRRDMQSTVTGILREHGFRKTGTKLIVENAAAAITPSFETALRQATAGLVTVQRTSMIIGQLFLDGFPDGNRGNYRGKAWLESYFNLLHNELASLPGQTGASYQLKPAELEGRQAEARRLLAKGMHLPVELRSQLRLPFLDLHEARQCIQDAFRRTDARTQHQIKGFDTITEIRLPGQENLLPWSAITDIPAELHPLIQIQPPRPESPLERWHRLHDPSACHRIPEAALPALLADHKLITYQTPKKFGFQLGGKTYAFWKQGLEEILIQGRQYLAYYDAQHIDAIHLTDAQTGHYIATAPLRVGVKIGDTETLAAEIAAKRRTLNAALDRVRARHADPDRMTKRVDDLSANIDLLEPAASASGENPRTSSTELQTAINTHEHTRTRSQTIDTAAAILKREARRSDQSEQPDQSDDDWQHL